ncbi:hypothetical protein Dda_3492 [Drechslerella dactyloides]|uniref:Cupin type-1 domain-containing protein n=1 Tax=Drechslerella dactyloides TaxID=74499 RepID=A0AAD6J3R4_DREDA|nr:hypothetical protein Dda_3492 [Drechslerella dactyloides]
MQATQLDRLGFLNSNGDWAFNFVKQPSYKRDPGSVVTANAANFPAVIGNGMSMALITLAPCGTLPAHIHPRAANYVIGVRGSTKTYFFEENGAKVVVNTLTPGIMTIFPQAALHTMFNDGCSEATLISALSSEDPGTLTFANSVFALPIDLVSNAFGADLSSVRDKIPALANNAIAGTRECLARCRHAFDMSKPVHVLKGREAGYDIHHLANVLGTSVMFAEPSQLRTIRAGTRHILVQILDGKEIEVFQIVSELHQDEICSLSEDLLMLAIIRQKFGDLVSRKVLTASAAASLRDAIAETYLPGSLEYQHALESERNEKWLFKPAGGGKGAGIVFRDDIPENDWRAFRFDLIMPDDNSVKHVSWNIVGTFFIVDGCFGGFGPWRSSEEKICALSRGGSWMIGTISERSEDVNIFPPKTIEAHSTHCGSAADHVAKVRQSLEEHGVALVKLNFEDPSSSYLVSLVRDGFHPLYGHGLPVNHSRKKGWLWDVKPIHGKTHTIWRRFIVVVPDEFNKDTSPTLVGSLLDMSFGEPKIRYRRDIIVPMTSEAEAALNELDSVLETCKSSSGRSLKKVMKAEDLPDGMLIVIDNAKWLHARSQVNDLDRHLRRRRKGVLKYYERTNFGIIVVVVVVAITSSSCHLHKMKIRAQSLNLAAALPHFVTLVASAANPIGPNPNYKRGLVYIPSKIYPNDDKIWIQAGSPLTWYYNYGGKPSAPLNGGATQLNFVPMLWGNYNDTFIADVTNAISQGYNITHVLGFNEPDIKGNGGSNITPAAAAARWLKSIQPLAELGIKLGAPAVTGTQSGIVWLKSFFSECSNCTFDFIPMHWYGNFDGLASQIGQYTKVFKNQTQTFWLTEVASIGPNATLLDENGGLTYIGAWYLNKDQIEAASVAGNP